MIKKSRIPSITDGRLDHSDPDLSISNGKEDKRALSFIKGREPTQAFQIRMAHSKWEFLKKICFHKNHSLNKLINDAIDEHLKFYKEEEELKKIRDEM